MNVMDVIHDMDHIHVIMDVIKARFALISASGTTNNVSK